MIGRLARFIVALVLLAGCTAPQTGARDPTTAPYMPQWRGPSEADVAARETLACHDGEMGRVGAGATLPMLPAAAGLPLSPGDTVKIVVPQGEQFTGLFTVDADGTLKLPFIPSVRAAGQPAQALEAVIAERLVAAQLFRASFVKVSVQTVQWAPSEIWVSGAVFQPGSIVINDRKVEDYVKPDQSAAGDYSPGRTLSAGLRLAGGVRPDADLSAITVERAGASMQVDMRGVMTGSPVQDMALIAGDRINVPSRGCFQEQLVRPSAITPPGIRVFLSNLTTPASGSASGEATSLPYGTRLLQALTAGNCVGGNALTNSGRYAVLISSNPVNGESEAMERSIAQLVSDRDRDQFNPYLLPGDSIACYESGVSTVRDVARALSDIVSPYFLFSLFPLNSGYVAR